MGSRAGGDEEDGIRSSECLAKLQSQTPAFKCELDSECKLGGPVPQK